MNPIQRRRLVVSEVVSDVDLVALILKDNIGPSTFAVARMVCKTWLSVCKCNESVLRGVAQYQGGLTKSAFMKLLAVTSLKAEALPRTTQKRYDGGTYYLYSDAAVNAVLKEGGMDGWRARLHFLAECPSITRWSSQRPSASASPPSKRSGCTSESRSDSTGSRSEEDRARARDRCGRVLPG